MAFFETFSITHSKREALTGTEMTFLSSNRGRNLTLEDDLVFR
jgi:hypothetical protein